MNQPRKPGIYEILNLVNGKRYIGGTKNVYRRKIMHRHLLLHNKHFNGRLQRDWNKYGEKCFKFKLLEAVKDTGLLLQKEQEYLDREGPEYNLSPTAGSNLGIIHSQDFCVTRSRLVSGKNHPNYGKSLKMETRKKISEALMGHSVSESARNKMSEAAKGKIVSDRTRELISFAHRGSKNNSAKLTEEQVKEIKTMLKCGTSGRDVSKLFGVTEAMISRIKLGKAWLHVKDDLHQGELHIEHRHTGKERVIRCG